MILKEFDRIGDGIVGLNSVFMAIHAATDKSNRHSGNPIPSLLVAEVDSPTHVLTSLGNNNAFVLLSSARIML